MKKFLIIIVAAIAAITLCSATLNESDSTLSGSVRFESTSMPSLNFTMSVSRANDIYKLMPESFAETCASEYKAVRLKAGKYTRFPHEGVSVTRTGNDPSMTIVFSKPGYKVIVSDVSWADLDLMFGK